jgi:hypothetical protein
MNRVDFGKYGLTTRVMKRVMKRNHHLAIANAPISIEMKVSSPPRLLPQAEGNFRQQHFWQLTGGFAERFGSPASVAEQTNYPQPAVAPANHCLASGHAGSLTHRAWGRTKGAYEVVTRFKQPEGTRKGKRIKKGHSLRSDPAKKLHEGWRLVICVAPSRLCQYVANRVFRIQFPRGVAMTQRVKCCVKLIEIVQCYFFWVPPSGAQKILYRKVIGDGGVDVSVSFIHIGILRSALRF